MKFEIDPEEMVRINEWMKKHNDTYHKGKSPYCGAAGGALTYKFAPTGLGTIIYVSCICKKEAEDFCATDWKNFG